MFPGLPKRDEVVLPDRIQQIDVCESEPASPCRRNHREIKSLSIGRLFSISSKRYRILLRSHEWKAVIARTTGGLRVFDIGSPLHPKKSPITCLKRPDATPSTLCGGRLRTLASPSRRPLHGHERQSLYQRTLGYWCVYSRI